MDPSDILPPVTKQDGADNSIAHAVLCAVEGRHHKVLVKAGLRESVQRLSLKNLLKNLRDVSGRTEGFTMDHVVSAMGGREVGGSSSSSVATGVRRAGKRRPSAPKSGVGLYVDHEGRKANGVGQSGVKVSISRIDTYELASKRDKELTWEEIKTGEVIRFADIAGEIRTNGPVVARFYMDSNFMSFSKESAVSFIYVGLPVVDLSSTVEMSDSGRKEQTGKAHYVTLIGFGGEGDEAYFIAQNSFGSDWGEDGMFRLCPTCVSHISIPILSE